MQPIARGSHQSPPKPPKSFRISAQARSSFGPFSTSVRISTIPGTTRRIFPSFSPAQFSSCSAGSYAASLLPRFDLSGCVVAYLRKISSRRSPHGPFAYFVTFSPDPATPTNDLRPAETGTVFVFCNISTVDTSNFTVGLRAHPNGLLRLPSTGTWSALDNKMSRRRL